MTELSAQLTPRARGDLAAEVDRAHGNMGLAAWELTDPAGRLQMSRSGQPGMAYYLAFYPKGQGSESSAKAYLTVDGLYTKLRGGENLKAVGIATSLEALLDHALQVGRGAPPDELTSQLAQVGLPNLRRIVEHTEAKIRAEQERSVDPLTIADYSLAVELLSSLTYDPTKKSLRTSERSVLVNNIESASGAWLVQSRDSGSELFLEVTAQQSEGSDSGITIEVSAHRRNASTGQGSPALDLLGLMLEGIEGSAHTSFSPAEEDPDTSSGTTLQATFAGRAPISLDANVDSKLCAIVTDETELVSELYEMLTRRMKGYIAATSRVSSDHSHSMITRDDQADQFHIYVAAPGKASIVSIDAAGAVSQTTLIGPAQPPHELLTPLLYGGISPVENQLRRSEAIEVFVKKMQASARDPETLEQLHTQMMAAESWITIPAKLGSPRSFIPNREVREMALELLGEPFQLPSTIRPQLYERSLGNLSLLAVCAKDPKSEGRLRLQVTVAEVAEKSERVLNLDPLELTASDNTPDRRSVNYKRGEHIGEVYFPELLPGTIVTIRALALDEYL